MTRRIINAQTGEETVDEGFVPVDLTEAAPRRTEGTFREFMDLFTPPEQLAIAGAAMSDVAVKLWYDRAMGGTVRLDAAETAQGLDAIVAGGLITQERADAILAADYDAA